MLLTFGSIGGVDFAQDAMSIGILVVTTFLGMGLIYSALDE